MQNQATIKKSRKKTIIAIVVIAVVVAVGLFGYNRLKAATQQALFTIPETVTLEKTQLESKVTASGNFESVDPVTIGSNTQGAEVDEVYVKAGDRVTAGDVLAQLDTADTERSITDTKETIAEAAKSDAQKLAQAQRAFDDADAQYYSDLEQNNQAIAKAQNNVNAAASARDAAKAAVPADPADPDYFDLQEKCQKAEDAVTAAQDAYDKAVQQRDNAVRTDNSKWYDAKAQLDALAGQDSAKKERTQLESLDEDLANASITASISGIVTTVNTEAGKAASGDMFTVENTEALQITASVAEYDIIKIEEGMAAHVTSNATDEQIYDGVVDFVAPVSADTSGNFEVNIILTSDPGLLKPGMTATVEIVTASKQDIFAVPIDAVVTLPDGTKAVYAYGPAGSPVSIGSNGARGENGAGAEGAPNAAGVQSAPAGANFAAGGERREIVVETGMETDYYIEISSDELSEGLLILSDPEGKNVQTSAGTPQFGMMGGAPVSVSAERPAGGPPQGGQSNSGRVGG
ncbi:MAG: efflux RND transporter periplasmic adaptor subunit [Clostridiales Family XIII bacterium]|jgi:RND family efflux transporter MFP subunit|nr:efflux RND transporter periplasmic adaptor subunit [Clostridiales Family XIII bacterium]